MKDSLQPTATILLAVSVAYLAVVVQAKSIVVTDFPAIEFHDKHLNQNNYLNVR